MFKIILAIFLSASLPLAANAQTGGQSVFPKAEVVDDYDQMNPRFGLTMGVADPEGNLDANAQIGLSYMAEPFKPFGLGFLITYSSFEDDNDLIDDYNSTSILGAGAYNFGGSIPILSQMYVGVLAGPVFETSESEDEFGFSGGPMAGVDFPLSALGAERVSIGAITHYLGMSTGTDAVFTLAGHLQYWY